MGVIYKVAFAESVHDKTPVDPNVVALLQDVNAFPPLVPSKPAIDHDEWQFVYSSEAQHGVTCATRVRRSPDTDTEGDLDEGCSVMTWEYVDDDHDNVDTQTNVTSMPLKQVNLTPSPRPCDVPIRHTRDQVKPDPPREQDAFLSDDEDDSGSDFYNLYKSMSRKQRVYFATSRRRKRAEAFIVRKNPAFALTPGDPCEEEANCAPSSKRNNKRHIPYTKLRKEMTILRKFNPERSAKCRKTKVDLSMDVTAVVNA